MSPRPLPYVFEHASNLKADPRRVMAYHLEPKNISSISPSWVRVLSLESPDKICEGSKICLKMLSLGLPQSWEVTVREVRDFEGTPAKAHILDVADRSPFYLWRHLHEFWAAPDGTTGLVDRIEFLPPFGFLGRLALPVIRAFFGVLFRARHEATRKVFESRQG
jgi:ligand-binding SRPBCC domain-containing protein